MYNATKDEFSNTNTPGMKSSVTALRDNAGEVADNIRDAGRKVRDWYHAASDEVTHATQSVTRQIRTKPVQSSLVALGIGFVLGSLFRR